jgi:hypothetical protein
MCSEVHGRWKMAMCLLVLLLLPLLGIGMRR